MSAPAFTPGPWEPRSRQAFGDDEIAIEPAEPQANKGRVIALCYGSDRETNARLIAAAPELYATLSELVATSYSSPDWQDVCCNAMDALAKARGEQ